MSKSFLIFLKYTQFLIMVAVFLLPFPALAANDVQVSDISNIEVLTVDTAVTTTINVGAGGQATNFDVHPNYIDLTVDNLSDITFITTASGQFLKITKESGPDSYVVNPSCPTTVVALSGTGAQVVFRLEVLTTNSCVLPYISFSTSTPGIAALPNGATNIILSNSTVIDISASVNISSAGHITIDGSDETLSNFTSGNLLGVNLITAQSVGDQSITINKAVTLHSGVDGQPFTLTNSDLASVSVSIPDATTILAPSGWDGKIIPPKNVSNSGTAPSGFVVGSTVIEVGSSGVVLLFDKPVTIIFNGVTGNVGYKPSGSSNWVRITSACGGSYASPTAPIFPGECYISDGTNTKIYTYHFSTFGSLNTVSGSAESVANTVTFNNGGGGSPAVPATPATGVNFSGQAFPNSSISLLRDGVASGATVAGPDAKFQISLTGLSTGNYAFSLVAKDKDGLLSQTQSFAISLTSGVVTNITGIFFAPTLSADKTEVRQGDTISFFGQTSPSASVSLTIHSATANYATTTSDNKGIYFYQFDTTPLVKGSHQANSKASLNSSVSLLSNALSFTVGDKSLLANAIADKSVCKKADLNCDGKVNIVDFSILAYWYHKDSFPKNADLNNDGKIDLVDFSIMAYYWTG